MVKGYIFKEVGKREAVETLVEIARKYIMDCGVAKNMALNLG